MQVKSESLNAKSTMNKEHRASYEDRIEFLIALMIKDYAKARDVGDRLLKRGQKDESIASILDILKQREVEARGRSGSTDDEAETDSEAEASDITDGDDTDSADDNAVIRVVAKAASKPASRDASGSSEDGISVDFKRKMYRVIPIRENL